MVWILLCGNSVTDLRKREISLAGTAFAAAAGLLLACWNHRSLEEMAAALLPGGLTLVFAVISREKIGYGDCLVLLTMGMYLTLQEIIEILFYAGVLCSAAVIPNLLVRDKDQERSLPFLPFLLLGYAVKRWMDH